MKSPSNFDPGNAKVTKINSAFYPIAPEKPSPSTNSDIISPKAINPNDNETATLPNRGSNSLVKPGPDERKKLKQEQERLRGIDPISFLIKQKEEEYPTILLKNKIQYKSFSAFTLKEGEEINPELIAREFRKTILEQNENSRNFEGLFVELKLNHSVLCNISFINPQGQVVYCFPFFYTKNSEGHLTLTTFEAINVQLPYKNVKVLTTPPHPKHKEFNTYPYALIYAAELLGDCAWDDIFMGKVNNPATTTIVPSKISFYQSYQYNTPPLDPNDELSARCAMAYMIKPELFNEFKNVNKPIRYKEQTIALTPKGNHTLVIPPIDFRVPGTIVYPTEHKSLRQATSKLNMALFKDPSLDDQSQKAILDSAIAVNFQYLSDVYKTDDNGAEVCNMISAIAVVVASRHNLSAQEFEQAYMTAKEIGGISYRYNAQADSYKALPKSEINPKFKRFSKDFQILCNECGIYSARNENIGLRFTRMPSNCYIIARNHIPLKKDEVEKIKLFTQIIDNQKELVKKVTKSNQTSPQILVQ